MAAKLARLSRWNPASDNTLEAQMATAAPKGPSSASGRVLPNARRVAASADSAPSPPTSARAMTSANPTSTSERASTASPRGEAISPRPLLGEPGGPVSGSAHSTILAL